MRRILAFVLAGAVCAWAQSSSRIQASGRDAGARPIEIKVVVVAMFEIGADAGDAPGEYQYWVQREHLDTVLPFPQGYHDLRLNRETGVLGVLTGVGTARAAASIMAVGLDPRFDLTHAYFLVAGIGGIDPNVGSLGSAVWNDWVVDGDLGYEIDAREIPPDWPTGYVPLRRSVPYEQPPDQDTRLAYRLNPALVDWAYELTRGVELPDPQGLQKLRLEFDGTAAHRPPFVLKGGNLSASTFWHGELMQRWAENWVKYMTGGQATYAICGMEDSGTMQSLTWLARAHKVDLNRVLVLRAASNFDVPKRGETAAESLAGTKLAHYTAFMPSLDAAYRVGHVVVDDIVDHWAERRTRIPGDRAK
jgi:purine nucleoside permease